MDMFSILVLWIVLKVCTHACFVFVLLIVCQLYLVKNGKIMGRNSTLVFKVTGAACRIIGRKLLGQICIWCSSAWTQRGEELKYTSHWGIWVLTHNKKWWGVNCAESSEMERQWPTQYLELGANPGYKLPTLWLAKFTSLVIFYKN